MPYRTLPSRDRTDQTGYNPRRMLPAFFEGPEKKLEIAVVDGFPSLRSLGDERWASVVEAADAQIISKRSNEHFDAYLLSESSLFVYDNFFTLITCGRTRLVDAAAKVLGSIPRDAIAVLFYERKNEHFPQEQPTSFYEDARRLRACLPGRAIRFGAEHEHAVFLFHSDRPHAPMPDDVTIEVLMHGIDDTRAAAFRGAHTPDYGSLAYELGLDAILPGMEIDERAFSPAGYSLNGMHGKSYVSLHVTPERIGSYVSFETNADFRDDPAGLVRAVIDRFNPESFDVVTFVPDDRPIAVELDGYRLRRQICEIASGYHVTFQHFYRPGAAPGRAFAIHLGGD